MASSSLLDTIELFDHIGAHYALPSLDRAAPAPVLAGALCHLFALVETAFNDAVKALDVDLTRWRRAEAGDACSTPPEESPLREERRVFSPRYVASSSPLSSPPPATPADSPLASKTPVASSFSFSAGKTVETYCSQPYTWPPTPPRSSSSVSGCGLSSVDWDDCDGDFESDFDDHSPAAARPAIVPDRSLSVLHAPYMVPQPSGTSSRPPPGRVFDDPPPRHAHSFAARAPSSAVATDRPSSAATRARSSAATRAHSSAATTASARDDASSSVPRKRPRPHAQRHSAPGNLPAAEPRRAARASKTNAQASWSWLVSKRRKTESGAGAHQTDDG